MHSASSTLTLFTRVRSLVPAVLLTGHLLASAGLAWGSGPVGHGQEMQSPAAQAVAGSASADALRALHREEEWVTLASHLPDPATASAAQLELAGDVLRARRFPEKATDYYQDAYRKGGEPMRLLNKLGITELSLRQTGRARSYFKLVVKKDKKDADAWNNLGATEYLDGHYAPAVVAYKRALKLNPLSAIFHANLGAALIDKKEYEDARKEFATALDLDPEFGTRASEGSGFSAHVLSPEDRSRFCLEMARVYASRGRVELMLNQLAMAADAGADVADSMTMDSTLAKYRKDPRVVLLIQNSKAMKRNSMASLAGMVPLPSN